MEEKKNNQKMCDIASFYDINTSSMSVGVSSNGFGSNFVYMSVAPVYQDMKGRTELHAGDKVYNYDDKIFLNLNYPNAVLLRKGITDVVAGKYAEFIVTTTTREISVVDQSFVEDSAHKGIYLFVTDTSSETGKVIAHCLFEEEFQVSIAEDDTAINETLNLNLQHFLDVLDASIAAICGPLNFTLKNMASAAKANGVLSTSSSSAPTRKRNRAAGASEATTSDDNALTQFGDSASESDFNE